MSDAHRTTHRATNVDASERRSRSSQRSPVQPASPRDELEPELGRRARGGRRHRGRDVAQPLRHPARRRARGPPKGCCGRSTRWIRSSCVCTCSAATPGRGAPSPGSTTSRRQRAATRRRRRAFSSIRATTRGHARSSLATLLSLDPAGDARSDHRRDRRRLALARRRGRGAAARRCRRRRRESLLAERARPTWRSSA